MLVVRLVFTVALLYAIALGNRWVLLAFCTLVSLALEGLTLIIVGLTKRVEALEKDRQPNA